MLKLIGGSGLCVREECKEGTVWESDPKLCGTSCCLVVSLSVPCFFFIIGMWTHGSAQQEMAQQHGTAPHSTAPHRTRVARHSTAQHGTVRHHTARQQHGTTPLWYVALSRCQYLFFYRDVHGRKWHGITQYSNAWHYTRQGNARQHMARQQTPQRHTAQQHTARRGTASDITRLPQHETAAARHETATA